MREYGQVQCSLWHSTDFQGASDDARILALYLLTGPHSNGIGCYRLPDGYVAGDLGWDSERVSKAFDELSANGFAKRLEGVVLLPNFLRWNRIQNGNIAKARAAEFEALPKGQAKVLAARALLTFGNHWAKGFVAALETISKGYANQNPTLPNPKEEAKPAPVAPSAEDYRAGLWARWKALDDGGGGAFLSKQIKVHGEDVVLQAVEKTLDDGRGDPKAFLVGCIRAQAKVQGNADDIFAVAL